MSRVIQLHANPTTAVTSASREKLQEPFGLRRSGRCSDDQTPDLIPHRAIQLAVVGRDPGIAQYSDGFTVSIEHIATVSEQHETDAARGSSGSGQYARAGT
jgi:hypothetical protein